ncbi:hypothetical protein ANMWB30_30290 [Arthrobacter sp. MWB30]|nr:hypothetical protein ANMWB30_30290 [Arthrobacter sp. MWB30]
MQFTHREFPYSFGHWRCMLNGGGGAVPEQNGRASKSSGSRSRAI